jgi:hypothetical protein
MNMPGAIVVAAGLVAGALLLTSQSQSQSTTIGRYQISSTGQDGRVAWRVDTATGDVVYCQASGAAPVSVTCQGMKP